MSQCLFQGSGSIGIDDIWMPNTGVECPQSGDCDMEDFDLCGYTQSQDDDFDWMRGSGETINNGTGPHSDHTPGLQGESQMI